MVEEGAKSGRLIAGLQDTLAAELRNIRKNMKHAGATGTASEDAWKKALAKHLPTRYSVAKGFVIDSRDQASDEIDLVIHDRHFTPLVFAAEGSIYIPAEGVYGVLEVKQEISKGNLEYAGNKVESVRRLTRTSAPIEHLGGRETSPPPPFRILGGIVALDCEWKDLEDGLKRTLPELKGERSLDIGCAIEKGAFEVGASGELSVFGDDAVLGAFLLSLLGSLQSRRSVPAMDFGAYQTWRGGKQ